MSNERFARLVVFAGAAPSAAAVVVFCSWWYTASQLQIAARHGIFPTAEEGVRQLVSTGYVAIEDIEIVYAGPNSFRGTAPHVWFVITKVRAASRIGGSGMAGGTGNCDGPGSFFLDIKDGWVQVPEGAFPELIGFWMNVYGLAGPGKRQPSIQWDPSRLNALCQSA